MQELAVLITADGRVRFMWDDSLAGLCEEGQVEIRRAGDVEPTPDGKWQVDCSRIGGSIHGPFRLRDEAIEVERTVVKHRLMAGLIK